VTTHAMGTPRAYSASNATRLLSAGAYLERQFRKRVIHELVACRFRFAAPSYGYDAVTVLAHALAARSLERKQAAGVIVGLVVDVILVEAGVIGWPGGLLIAVWVVWAFAFLRRAATLQALSRLRADGTVGGYPADRALTPDLIDKITREQEGSGDAIIYGGYFPFVGAGWPLPDWSTAELLIPARTDPAAAYLKGEDDDGDEDDPGGGDDASLTVIPFTVAEITDYVAKRLRAQLSDDVLYGGRIERLTVERRKYSGAGRAPIVRRWGGAMVLAPTAPAADWAGALESQDSRERYDATREFLCIRVGAWDEELVISMFVGFDLRGNTLYSEFYPYVLPPVRESFHLVDQLPEQLTPRLLLRVGWHVPVRFGGMVLETVLGGPVRVLRWLRRRGRVAVSLEPVVDNSEFRLGRYATALVDRGALVSVRELAATTVFHHFFQEADQAKYIKIVERQLFQIKGEFLTEHHVDLGDHDRNQTKIIDASTQTFSDFTINGGENFSVGGRRVYHQSRTSAERRDKP
jgi:hypothetical protein